MGNLVYVCLFKREQKGGGWGSFLVPFRCHFRPDRVPAKPNNCLGLASRTKRPATSAGVSVWHVSRGLCDARKASCANRRGNLWAV